MLQINATIDESLKARIDKLAKKEDKSFSKMTYDLLEYAVGYYENKRKNKQEEQNKQTQHLLSLLNISSEILKKVFGEPSAYPGKTADQIVNTLKSCSKKSSKK